MFAFLFSWTDANWLHRRKTKMFRFTPTPVSSASIFWWCGKGGFADRKCTLDDSLERWFDARFPPLSIYYGGRDYLVLTEPLLERLERKEKEVRVLKVTKREESEVSTCLSRSCSYALKVVSGDIAQEADSNSTATSTGPQKPSNGRTSRLWTTSSGRGQRMMRSSRRPAAMNHSDGRRGRARQVDRPGGRLGMGG